MRVTAVQVGLVALSVTFENKLASLVLALAAVGGVAATRDAFHVFVVVVNDRFLKAQKSAFKAQKAFFAKTRFVSTNMYCKHYWN